MRSLSLAGVRTPLAAVQPTVAKAVAAPVKRRSTGRLSMPGAPLAQP